MRTRLILLTLCTALFSACATTESVKEAQGQGRKQIFPQRFDAAYDAALAAAQKHRIDVIEQDRATGRIVLSHGLSLWSWGERIAIFLRRVSPTVTEVEIVSKPVLAPLNFPSDWESKLMFEIGEQLRSRR
jgi:hypothetical protein